MKIINFGFSIIPLIISLLASKGFYDVDESNIENYVSNTPYDVSNFIENNFEEVVKEYNDESNEIWSATYIEDRFDITIDDTENKYTGVFLDFDGDNGYAVIGNDYTFLDFSVKGTSPYQDLSSTEYYFSTVHGYLYKYDEEYLNVDTNRNTDITNLNDIKFGESYDGQIPNKSGCGNIYNVDTYVKDKYGTG